MMHKTAHNFFHSTDNRLILRDLGVEQTLLPGGLWPHPWGKLKVSRATVREPCPSLFPFGFPLLGLFSALSFSHWKICLILSISKSQDFIFSSIHSALRTTDM